MIAGRPNAGKTLFALNFAHYLGLSAIDVALRDAAGGELRRLPLSQARRAFVDSAPHKTRAVQSVEVRVPGGKGGRLVRLSDTPGLTDAIPDAQELRQAAALALEALRRARIILHVIDAARAAVRSDPVGPLDRQISEFAAARGPYLVLANKIDLLGAREGAARIAQSLPGRRVVPVSALRRSGFREVRAWLSRHV